MILILVDTIPTIGDYITYKGDKYQIISNVEETELHYKTYYAKGRYAWVNGFMEKDFYFQTK